MQLPVLGQRGSNKNVSDLLNSKDAKFQESKTLNTVFNLSDSATDIIEHIIHATTTASFAKTNMEGALRFVFSRRTIRDLTPNKALQFLQNTKLESKLAESLTAIETQNKGVSRVINQHLKGAIILGAPTRTPDAIPLISFLMKNCPSCIENLKPDEGPQGKMKALRIDIRQKQTDSSC